MNASHFDNLLRALPNASSRRGVLHGLAVLALSAVGLPGVVDAKKKHKKRKKEKVRFNDFGCVNVGSFCKNGDQCCSGICEGKKGKKDKSRCVAHNVLECAAGVDSCLGVLIGCGSDGVCFQTTGQASFCGLAGATVCEECHTDADCEANLGPGAACVVCSQCTLSNHLGCQPPATS